MPKHCRDQYSSCGEILVLGGLDYLSNKWSILAEAIHNLELPFGITFTTKDAFDAVVNEGRYLVAFLSCDTCELSRSYSRGLPRLSLPSPRSCSYKESKSTTYSYDSKKLGNYKCDFPTKNSYIVTRKHLRNQYPAISTLIERAKLSTETLSNFKFHERL